MQQRREGSMQGREEEKVVLLREKASVRPQEEVQDTTLLAPVIDLSDREKELEALLIDLREKVSHLETALESRILIEQAKGLIAGATGANIEDAFNLLRTYARDRHLRLHRVCASVITAATSSIEPLPSIARSTHLHSRSHSAQVLARTPLFKDIMQCWRDRPKACGRAWKVM